MYMYIKIAIIFHIVLGGESRVGYVCNVQMLFYKSLLLSQESNKSLNAKKIAKRLQN